MRDLIMSLVSSVIAGTAVWLAQRSTTTVTSTTCTKAMPTAHEDHWDECESTGHVTAEGHGDHLHGDGCGHETVSHDDHVDYLHGEHRHAAHAGHWDEH